MIKNGNFLNLVRFFNIMERASISNEFCITWNVRETITKLKEFGFFRLKGTFMLNEGWICKS